MNKFNVELGNRLREIRKGRNLTQEKFAEQLGIAAKHYGQIERGERGITLQKLKLLHEKFNADLLYLITGDRSHQVKINELISDCPKDKLFDLEQALKYISNLYK